jgi:hypothetical protein
MMSRFPVAFRPAGIGFLAIRCPLGSWAFLAVGLPDPLLASGPHRGCHVPHVRVATGVGALFTPGTVVLTRPTTSPRPPPAASQRQSPCTPVPLPSSEAPFNEASLRVHCIHPVG